MFYKNRVKKRFKRLIFSFRESSIFLRGSRLNLDLHNTRSGSNFRISEFFFIGYITKTIY